MTIAFSLVSLLALLAASASQLSSLVYKSKLNPAELFGSLDNASLRSNITMRSFNSLQSSSEILDQLGVCVNKSSNIESCGNRMCQTVAEMVVS